MQVGNIVDNLLDIAKSNIIYVPIDGSINTYITNATAGDTLVLAAGTYTVNSSINVSKALTIMGQGPVATTVNCSTGTVNVFNITVDNVNISDLAITTSGTGDESIQVMKSPVGTINNVNLTNLRITVNNSIAGSVYYVDAGGTIRDVVITHTAGSSTSQCFREQTSSADAIVNLNLINCDFTVTGTSGAALSSLIVYDGAAFNINLNTYNCKFTATGGTTNYGINAIGTQSLINAYTSVINGSTADVFMSSTPIVTLYGCTLVNNLTSGGTVNYVTTSNSSIFRGENIKYVPLTDSTLTQTQILQNAITNATAGDTLILAAGTYTITSGLVINKLLTIVGQGMGKTTIVNSTANVVMVSFTTSHGSSISDLTLDCSGTYTSRMAIINPQKDCNITRVEIKNACTGTYLVYVYQIEPTTTACVVNVEDCISTATGGGGLGCHAFVYADGVAGTVVNIRKCVHRGSNGNGGALGYLILYTDSTSNTINVYSSYLYDTVSTSPDNCICWGQINLYDTLVSSGIDDGTATPFMQYGSGTFTIYRTEVVQLNTSDYNIITYSGTVIGNHLQQAGQGWSTKYTCTTTLNWNNSNIQYIQLANGAQTFTFANPKDGSRYELVLKQPAGGAAGTVTWPGTVAWTGAITPTLTATNSAYDIITFTYDATNTKYYGGISYNYI